MVDTKLNDIDSNGLNGFERAHWKGGNNTGFINGIYWQYSNERRFLEYINEIGFIDHIKRGPPIKYTFDNKVRTYLSDYIAGNMLFEIKSKYTLYGPNNSYLQKNIAKLTAAKAFGYIVYIVVDDIVISFDELISSISNIC